MSCSTCNTIRRIINAPMRRLGLPTLPLLQQPQPPAVQQQRVNPAWPTRGTGR